ncbi:MAG: TonB-dependent receptor, partial [Lysobacteraceae bacterium]
MIVSRHKASFVRHSMLAASIASLIPLSIAHAQDVVEQPQIVVTGVRHAQTVDDSLASVTVITREDIDKSPAVDLLNLLSQQTGVDISRTGGAGQSSTIFLRGTNSNQTLVLIDGVRVASATQGVFDFAHLPLDQIERIEIVRGPRAAFWGSDSIGGVIQIFTHKPEGVALRSHVGSYGERGGGVSLGTGDGTLGVTLGYDRLRGFSATNPSAFGYNPDDDGYRNSNLSVRGSTALGTQTLAYTALYTDANVDFDQGTTHVRNGSAGIALSGDLGDGWSHRLGIGHAREDLDTPDYDEKLASRRNSLDWVVTRNLGTDANVTTGINWQREQGTSISAYSGTLFDNSRTNTAGFIGYGGRFGSQLLDLAVRYDHNSQFGSATTGSAAWGWQINPQTKLRLSWGQGFRAPDFNELYSPGYGGYYAGNPDLLPERSNSFEGGVTWTPARGHTFEVSLWRTRVHDLVDYSGPLFQEINIDRAAIDGGEISYRYSSGHWSAGVGATIQHARNTDTGLDLLRR